MTHRLTVDIGGKYETVYIYVDWDADYNFDFTFNKKLYSETECLAIEHYLDRNYDEIRLDLIQKVKHGRNH
jgi:hypothetical protein